jgi:hypothetical protein
MSDRIGNDPSEVLPRSSGRSIDGCDAIETRKEIKDE